MAPSSVNFTNIAPNACTLYKRGFPNARFFRIRCLGNNQVSLTIFNDSTCAFRDQYTPNSIVGTPEGACLVAADPDNNDPSSAQITGSCSGAYDPTIWLGTYTLTSGCDQSQCCCAQTSTITATGNEFYTVTGTNLAGQCGSTSSSSSVSVSVPVPTSDSGVTYTVNGQSHTASRQSNGGIYDQNNADARCSATLSKGSSSDKDSSARSTSSALDLFCVILLIAAVTVAVAAL